MKIASVLQKGRFDVEHIETTEDIIAQSHRALDHSRSYDILGNNLFLGEDGKFYTVVVEAELRPAAMRSIEEILQAEGSVDLELILDIESRLDTDDTLIAPDIRQKMNDYLLDNPD